MPNNPNAAKAHRQSEKRRVVNRSGRTVLKNLVKRFRLSLQAPATTAPSVTLTEITKHVDQAASKKLIHKKAARIKSRLTKAANKKSAASK